ncbi:SecDF P1 head subdomain-containing protein [Yinghuangia soli]|uniref:SecDF P1 head subdomain domain-containing protein n=1 Tax=Yinghuangia soli TaxID=2908204 RepID=A0AA41Q8D6_9ACTN|nr:hypothetical protein [Yinghuangia soli]MCF2532611.1 hypothetical protein [Yinghuangia soli]
MMRQALAAVAIGALLLATGCSDRRERRDEPPPIPSGLDLADVVLTPAVPLTDAQLQHAATVVERRAEALGIRVEQAAPRDGTVALRLSVRGLGETAEDRVRQLGRQATLTIRPVLALAGLPSGAVYQGRVPPELAAEFAAVDCSRIGDLPPDPADRPVVVCDADGNWKYVLGPAAVDGDDVDRSWSSYSEHSSAGGWQVVLVFTEEGQAAFRELLHRPPDENDNLRTIAFVVRGTVVSAPSVVDRTDLEIRPTIYANITERTADELAGVIDAGPLPATFTVTSYVHVN